MNILQISLPKSGTFWLANILSNIVKEAGIAEKAFVKTQPIYEAAKTWDLPIKNMLDINMINITNEVLFYRIANIFIYPIQDFNEYINNTTNVWTHSLACCKTPEVLEKFDKTVYIIRDPRDVAISWSHFAFTPFMKKHYYYVAGNEVNPESFLKNKLYTCISDWMNHVGGYLKSKKELDIYVIFYENLCNNFNNELQKMLEYLEIELDSDSIARIKEQVDFTSMKKDSPDHVREGGFYKWKNVLSNEQKEKCWQIAQPLLSLLNYPLGDHDLDKLPRIPVELPEVSSLPSGPSVCLNCKD
ncbi:sulfotransferase domain-containing protein [Moorena sp. SIO4G3]|uniref:sulfotransferase domain-containing protein n=1 Tax=Moorena sp. SIO4G3 TaxID=2607821 RepID=UPI0013C83AC7|nr:sulfotransferase domain-containing protein [Moorena sp. SIO4G3]NEO79901.1 sulfotransferase domain-containing protein [Moorena sp. SIO4G3]NEO90206.1 sulfotransferase domain-containing protein [Moorena sp. SIO3G5]